MYSTLICWTLNQEKYKQISCFRLKSGVKLVCVCHISKKAFILRTPLCFLDSLQLNSKSHVYTSTGT